MTDTAAEYGGYGVYEGYEVYRIYIDSLFLMNFVLNLYLYTLAAKSLRRTATRIRVFAGSAAGALFSVIIIFIGMPPLVKRWIAPIAAGMAVTAGIFKLKKISEIFRFTGCLFIYAFMFGGFLNFIFDSIPFLHSRQDSVWLILGAAFFARQLIGWWVLKIKEKKEADIYPVRLCGEGEEVTLRALMDTGNSLRDPISGKPVSVVEEGILEQLSGVKIPEKLKLIPYHSVGKANGIMEGYEVPEICVGESGEEIRWQKVIVGISKNKISAGGAYQMILHPDLKR